MSLTIESIHCWLVDIPTIRPHKLSMATMGCQTLTIVRMTCAGGITGWGEATTIGGLSYGPESPESIRSAIETYLAPALCGQTFSGAEVLSHAMRLRVRGNSFARSAQETAFLDAQGKALGVPVSTLLGGQLSDRLPVLWTLASGDTARDIAEGQQLLSEGRHVAFKLKIGAGALKADIRHALAIKAALGDEVTIQVDVNQSWDYASALQGIAALEAGGIAVIEQPLPLWDLAGLAALSQRFRVTLLADEALADSHDGYALAAAGFRGGYALKIAKAGGPLQALHLAHSALAAGIGLYGGTMLEGTLGTVAALHAWSTLPLALGSEMFGPLLLKDDIVVTPLDYREGGVRLPQLPGLGVEVDQDKLARYARR